MPVKRQIHKYRILYHFLTRLRNSKKAAAASAAAARYIFGFRTGIRSRRVSW